MRLARLLPLLLLTAAFDPLGITKTSAVVSDPQGNLLPKRVPGSFIDYTATISNPNGAFTTVNGVTFTDKIPDNTVLRVDELAILNGPVVVITGLSLLTYTYTSLGSTTDRLDFSNDNGVTWIYTPTADASGCDSQVTNIRVRMAGSQLTGTSFTIRFRVKVR
jgi:uncharacterized repeat protein (TIGR01451 family)